MVASTSSGSVPASTSSRLVGGVGCSRARDCTRLRAASTAQAANGREAASSARGTPTSSRTTVLDRSSDAVVASPAASAATSSVTWVGQPIAEPSVPASSRPAEVTVRRTTVAAVAGTSIRLRTPGEPREQDGDQDDRPIGRVDPERGDLRQGEDVGDDGQQQDTQERAEHRAPPPVDAHPANRGTRSTAPRGAPRPPWRPPPPITAAAKALKTRLAPWDGVTAAVRPTRAKP